MRNIKGDIPESPIARFILGGGIGLALSIPLFMGIEDIPVRIGFMAAMTALMGSGQVMAGSKAAQERGMVRWSLFAGTLLLVTGLVILFILL